MSSSIVKKYIIANDASNIIKEDNNGLHKGELFQRLRRHNYYDSSVLESSIVSYLQDQLKINFAKMRDIGSGQFGSVYKVNNKAVKIAQEGLNNEVLIEQLIRDGEVRGFVRVFSFIKIPIDITSQFGSGKLRDAVIVVMELLSSIDEDLVYEFMGNRIDIPESFTNYSIFKGLDTSNINVNEVLYRAFYLSFSASVWNDFKPMFEQLDVENRTTFFTDMWNAGLWLIKNGIPFKDFHTGNIMYDKKKKQFKIVDVI
jgi:serine/threonine protein kinase